MLGVHLLGERRIVAGARDAGADIQYRKAWALLGFLAVEAHRRHPREDLARLLWPTLPALSARTNLRQVLANLNRVLDAHGGEGLLVVTRDDVGLVPREGVVIDLHRLLRVAETGEPAELLASAEAIAGFGAEFLAGLAFDDCPEFEAWLHAARARLAATATRALRRVFEAQQAAGRSREAVATAGRLALLDPWGEEAQARWMAALATDGQYAEALSAFDAFRATMEADLGVLPSPSIRALRDAIEAAMDGVPGVLPAFGTPVRAASRHWACLLLFRAVADTPGARDRGLADASEHCQTGGARFLFAGKDMACACVVAEGEPGDLRAAALRAARLALSAPGMAAGRLAMALCPGIVQSQAGGGVAMVGHPGDAATDLLAASGPGQVLLCDGLFDALFEDFALHRQGEVAVPGLVAPVRLWRLGAEGGETFGPLALAGLGDPRSGPAAASPVDAPAGPEPLTLRIGEGDWSGDDVPSSGAWLTVVEGVGRGTRVAVGDRLVVVGRSGDCDLHLPRRTVSRHHCVVWRDADHYRIRDLGATNRTALNGAGIREARLRDGDLVAIGDCTLRFGRELETALTGSSARRP